MVKTITELLQQRPEQKKQQPLLPALQQKSKELVSTYGNRESFLTTFNPDVQREICGNTDVCFFGGAPTLTLLNNAYGEKTAAMWLVPQLYNLSEYCGCKDKLDGNPLKECASVIATEFYYLSVTELMLFFHWFKSGKYGRFYGSIDPLVITTSLRGFLNERAVAYEKHERKERERADAEYKKTAITYDEYLSKKGKKISKAAESSKPAKPTTTPHEERKRNSEYFTKSCAENLISNAYHCKPDDLKMMRDMFKNKYGCTPEEYIDKNDK